MKVERWRDFYELAMKPATHSLPDCACFSRDTDASTEELQEDTFESIGSGSLDRLYV